MVEQGARHREICEVFDVEHTVITRTWARFQQYGTPLRRHGGCRRATTEAGDRFLVIQARSFETATQLRSDFIKKCRKQTYAPEVIQ